MAKSWSISATISGTLRNLSRLQHRKTSGYSKVVACTEFGPRGCVDPANGSAVPIERVIMSSIHRGRASDGSRFWLESIVLKRD